MDTMKISQPIRLGSSDCSKLSKKDVEPHGNTPQFHKVEKTI